MPDTLLSRDIALPDSGRNDGMRIAYLTWQPFTQETGVSRKIGAQLQMWRDLGHQARLFVMSDGAAQSLPLRRLDAEAESSGNYAVRNWRVQRLLTRLLAWRPDVCFFRLGAYYRPLNRLLNAVPVVLDVNTADLVELRRTMARPVYWYYRYWRQRLLQRVAGVTAVTNELLHGLPITGVPTAVISNGICLETATPLRAPGNARPRAVFIGTSGRPWHGVEKLVWLARRLPRVAIDVVGYESRELGATTSNLMAHGHLSETQYRPFLARADAAFGTLALYRNGMREGCVLKVREYLAAGIPTIIGYDDVDFPEPTSFLLRMPGEPANVQYNVNRIEHFLEQSRGLRVCPGEIAHLDLRQKETQRIAFFREVIRAWAKRSSVVT